MIILIAAFALLFSYIYTSSEIALIAAISLMLTFEYFERKRNIEK